MGNMALGKASATSVQEAHRSDIPDGRLWVTPAYYQTSGDAAVQLDSADDWIAARIIPQTDMLISSVSRYVTAEATQGDGTLAIYSDATAIEPNGDLNGSENAAPTMTAEDAPSPYEVTGTDSGGNPVRYSPAYAAWRMLDGDASTHWSAFRRTAITDGESAVDKGGTPNLVGIPCVAHGRTTGEYIEIAGTSNYDGIYAVDATSSTDEIVIESAYSAETFGAADWVNYGATTADPIYWMLDHGDGGAICYNKVMMQQATGGDAYPSEFTIDGSNEASADPANESHWTELTSESSVTSPGSGLKKAFTFTNDTAYRYYRIKFTGRGNTGSYHAIAEIELFAAESTSAPGTELQELGTLSSGGSADAWTRLAVASGDQYQAQRGTPIWLIMKGAAAADWSESIRRPNTVTGSAMPDEMNLCKYTTDGGTTWTQALQNDLPAMWNVVVNSHSTHCPQLCYGRYTGKYIYIPDYGMMEIPEAGILYDFHDHAPSTWYMCIIPNTEGTGQLVAAYNGQTFEDGIETWGQYFYDTGDGTKISGIAARYLGRAKTATDIIGSAEGPVDVKDRRLVSNLHNRRVVSVGKDNPYSANTSHTPGLQYEPWGNDTDWVVEVVCAKSAPIDVSAQVNIGGQAGQYLYLGIGFDSKRTIIQNSAEFGYYGNSANGSKACGATVSVSPGLHYLVPLVKQTGTTAGLYFYWNSVCSAQFHGTMEA